MAYSKQTWDTSSYVNPTRMNHIEDGIEGVSDSIDNLDATNIPYDSNTSVKEKIDDIADTISVNTNYIYTYPLESKTMSNVGNWLTNFTIPVKKGDIVSWTLKSSATSGAFTTNVSDSVGNTYSNGARNHNEFNNPNVVAVYTMVADANLVFTSYTNTATTITNGCITVSRKS